MMAYVVDKNFVQTVRAVEHALGIPNSFPGLPSVDIGVRLNVTEAIATIATVSSPLSFEVSQVLLDSIPIIIQIALELNFHLTFGSDEWRSSLTTSNPLVTKYGLNSQLVSTRRVDDDVTVLWISTGNSTTLLTLLMPLSDNKRTIAICIIRKFEPPFYSAS